MKLKFLIIDDEPLAQRVIENYAKEVSTIEFAGKCKSAFEAMEFLNNNRVDLIFLDINMPKLSGMDFLRSLKNPPIIIITTAYREYAVESYDLDVIDYLKKPFSFGRFYKAVQKAQETFKIQNPKWQKKASTDIRMDDNQSIYIKSDKKIYRVDLDNILYVEALGDYIKIYTRETTIVSYSSLKKIEGLLPTEKFRRIHKSFIISLNKIDLVEGNIVVINKNQIPVGRNYRRDFFSAISS